MSSTRKAMNTTIIPVAAKGSKASTTADAKTKTAVEDKYKVPPVADNKKITPAKLKKCIADALSDYKEERNKWTNCITACLNPPSKDYLIINISELQKQNDPKIHVFAASTIAYFEDDFRTRFLAKLLDCNKSFFKNNDLSLNKIKDMLKRYHNSKKAETNPDGGDDFYPVMLKIIELFDDENFTQELDALPPGRSFTGIGALYEVLNKLINAASYHFIFNSTDQKPTHEKYLEVVKNATQFLLKENGWVRIVKFDDPNKVGDHSIATKNKPI